MPAIVFDLDETLLDTSMLRDARTAQRFAEVGRRLDEVHAYGCQRSDVQAAELPARVRALGYRVGVLTHSPRWYAERLLDAFGIPYDALITGSDGYAPKPDPSSLRAIAAELGVSAHDTVMVGDDAVDIAAGQAAGALTIGVAWSRRAPDAWRRRWPDIAVARPDRVLDVLHNAGPRFPFAEALLAGDTPLWHWGSMLRLGNGVYGAGHYFTTSDHRHPGDALSRLVIAAKNDPRAADRIGQLLAALVETPWNGMAVDLITSVPPKPAQEHDRLDVVRAAIAEVAGLPERGDVLTQLFDDPDYKHARADERAHRVAGRFRSAGLDGERVLLVDDVVTSGGQALECRQALIGAGAASVKILALAVTQDTLPRACPDCGGMLRLVTSGYKPFIGCSNYYRLGCRHQEPAPEL